MVVVVLLLSSCSAARSVSAVSGDCRWSVLAALHGPLYCFIIFITGLRHSLDMYTCVHKCFNKFS